MAIIKWLPGIAITVQSNDRDLPEHVDPYPPPPPPTEDHIPTHCYSKTEHFFIESTTNAEFTVNLSVGKPFEMDHAKTCFEVYVDGKLVAEPHLARPDYKRAESEWTYQVKGAEKKLSARKYSVQKFRFKEIERNEDDSKKTIEADKKKVAGTGEILVKIFRKSYGKTAKPTPKAPKPAAAPASVAEKALKGETVSHGTYFKNPEKAEKNARFETDYKDGKEHPIAIFSFKYRSTAALKSEHIIPRTPSPEPARDPRNVTLEEKIAKGNLSKEQRQYLEKYLNIKPDPVKSEQKIKREQPDLFSSSGKRFPPAYMDLVRKRRREERMSGEKVVVELSSDEEYVSDEDVDSDIEVVKAGTVKNGKGRRTGTVGFHNKRDQSAKRPKGLNNPVEYGRDVFASGGGGRESSVVVGNGDAVWLQNHDSSSWGQDEDFFLGVNRRAGNSQFCATVEDEDEGEVI